MRVEVEPIELGMDELEALLERARISVSAEDYQTMKHLVDSYRYVLELVEDKQTTIKRLRQILFGHKTETTRNVQQDVKADAETSASGQEEEATTPPADESPAQTDASSSDDDESPKRRGHGRNGADAYEGADKIRVSHATLQAGEACPCCHNGKLYEQHRPRVIVRLRGQAPVEAKVYELQKLRCHLCGKLFTAEAPEGIGQQKYDATSASMIALLRYGNGMAFNRLAQLQNGMGIPLPASTQWDVVNHAAKQIESAYEQLIREAAQGQILHNDDTGMKVLELIGRHGEA